MTQTEVLGDRMRIAGFCCLGTVPSARLAHLLGQVVALAGMDTAGMQPKVWAYPLPDGRGGTGETGVQPLVESFLAMDTWPELETPRVYVVLASCKEFLPDAIAAYLAKEIGPVVRQGVLEL